MAEQVIITIFNLTKFIIQWHQDFQDSKQVLVTMVSTVSLVDSVVKGINTTLYDTLETPLRALMDCLSEAKDMLIANAKKKGSIKQFLFPKIVSDQMHVVESRIHKLVNIMTLAVSTTHLNISSPSALPSPSSPLKKPNALDFITNEETKKFWLVSFGDSVYSVKWLDLEKALMSRYNDFVDAEALSDLHLRLDNLDTGFVSCHRLSDFCGSESLSKRLQAYTQKRSIPTTASPDITYPLLLWVDDNPGNNQAEIDHAEQRGVQVVTVNSTSEAKQWIIRHPQVVEEENPDRFRIITDNAREGADTTLDINAGEDMIRFVRGRRSKVPMLVYCGNLAYTKYTSNYKICEAANNRDACLKFINSLTV